MPPRNRPTALEISFQERLSPDDVSTSNSTLIGTPFLSSSGSTKRRPEDNDDSKRSSKRPRTDHRPRTNKRPPVAFFAPSTNEEPMSEIAMLDHFSEDIHNPDDHDSKKPIFILSDFSIYDTRHRRELIDLGLLGESDGSDRSFEGVGLARPMYEYDDEEGDLDTGQYVELGAIFRYDFDFVAESPSRSTWIETQYIWYILEEPSSQYKETFRYFLTPRCVAQKVLATAKEHPSWSREAFVRDFMEHSDPFGRQLTEDDVTDAQPCIQEAFEKDDSPGNHTAAPFLRGLLPKHTEPSRRNMRPRERISERHRGNPDFLALKQCNPTHVTERIAVLTNGLIGESLKVVGPKPQKPTSDVIKRQEQEKERAHKLLCQMIQRAHLPNPSVQWSRQDIHLKKSGRKFIRSVKVHGEEYKPEDVIVVPIEREAKSRKEENVPMLPHLSDIPEDASIADYFWFGKIIFIDITSEIAHIQWFNHGSQIVLGELAHPQELFLQELCDPIALETICGKVVVHETRKEKDWISIPSDEYFYKLMYDPVDASFTTPDRERSETAKALQSPDNCPVCLLNATERQLEIPEPLLEVVDDKELLIGVSYRGQCWHLDDFVLYHNSTDGPAYIGYITRFQRKDFAVTVRKVGRINSLRNPGLLNVDYFRDERSLYLTNETDIFPVKDLIRIIYVAPRSALKADDQSGNDLREDWVSQSPYHYYIKYVFDKMEVSPAMWRARKLISHSRLKICTSCLEAEQKRLEERQEFLEYIRQKPLPTLDLFGGVGGFGIGLAQGSLCLKVTHAVEILPSAAITYRQNSPETTVINQCANLYLQYAVKSQTKETMEVHKPKDLYHQTRPIPDPPKRGDIKVLVAGFPCQTHSALNMYKRSDDPKSNLLLTTLSEVDRLKPNYCFFENVPGFLSHRLMATQVTSHRVVGGIEQGGLKLLERAMLDMGYQTRFGILEAGHYGTPQSRVRFFMVAAKLGLKLPLLPQPTHDFPSGKQLKIALDDETTISPIRSCRGTAAHQFISVRDAIGDLPQWDWKLPLSASLTTKIRDKIQMRKKVPSVLYKGVPHPAWGDDIEHEYQGPPITRYQAEARSERTKDLQHFTKQVLPKVAARVWGVDLKKGADFRSIDLSLGQYQLHNPESWNAKYGNRGGAYSRLDNDGYFNTIITNVDPTAKQCRVLHPSCYRMLTVRELARSQGFPDWFEFFALKNNVVTHRHIGNAVAWPVSRALGRSLQDSLFDMWTKQKREAIEIDNDSD
ncbi:S-adenosyl-L-methionine-dependent methyltransferase [Dendrothele bispora CBS 962.96]|uniref:DNA (cytosine-5-)-methyltransferase n=1 Tax=Dendrothele bispora (strain CBS 962.96) TaxID=1314807 RepID=A0A4S8MTK4_DENBC|nr:S-adenosyl-L-methionine-dependent methyltransferase [Dendrothele bispora CBS 962.96]